MAQELFMTDEKERQIRKEQLIKRGFQLWESYAEEYRVLPFKYLFYLQERREAKLPLRKIHATSCKKELYPDIPFFRILSPDEAMVWLESKDVDTLEAEIHVIEFALETNYLYRTMKTWVTDTIYILSRAKPKPNSLARGTTSGTTSSKPGVYKSVMGFN